MEILITGANGFLGNTIVNQLTSNHTISRLSRSCGDYRISLENEIPSFNKKFDLVIHSAGKAHSVPKTASENKRFYDVNVLGTQNLLKGLKQIGQPKQFVFISSAAVYGKESGKNINEDFPLLAKDAYGLSKIEAEKMVIEWCTSHQVICTILRLPLLVGKNPPGNLGAMVKAINKGYYFNIGVGKSRKSMVLAEDVALFIPIVASLGGIYNLTDGVHPSLKELSTKLMRAKNKSRSLNIPTFLARIMGYIGDILGDNSPVNTLKIKKLTSDLVFDDIKARTNFGWKPQGVLEYLENNTI